MSTEPFVARMLATIDRRDLLVGGETVVLAVSGGPDSMAMLHALASVAPDLSLELTVAHFDHRLRPDSGVDAALVEQAATSLGLPFIGGEWATPGEPAGASPEEAARRARARFLDDAAVSVGATRVATGHTMDDQAETVLMRLLQGTGRRGLGGIDPRRWYRVRPLIDHRRSETVAYCASLGIEVISDPTNADRRFLRNEIRLGTIPFLAGSINGRLTEALARLADLSREEDAYLDARAAEGAQAITDERGETRLSIDEFEVLPVALQRRALRLATWTHNGAVFAAEHTERLRVLALSGGNGAQLDLPEGIRARVEYRVLVLGARPSDVLPPETELIVPGETDVIGWDLRVRSWITPDQPTAWPDGRTTAALDADAVTAPLTLRAVRDGDRFQPLGMQGEKKVGDFFTDEQVPRARRADVPLIVDADDRIAWVVGHRVSDRFKVTPSTRRTLWIAV